MVVKTGYKQTELGPIPNDWELKKFGDIFNFSGGYSASREQLSVDGYCYLHYGDIHGSKKTFFNTIQDFQDIPKLKINLAKINKTSLLSDGDVVFVDASEDNEGTSRHVVIENDNEIPFISGLHTIVAKSKTHELTTGFKRFCFQNQPIKQQFIFYSVGTKVSGINKRNIPKITIALPPTKAEQEAIAETLSDADALIESLEKLIAKKRLVKQGAMQELLTGKRRLPGFKGPWRNMQLGELIEHCSSGATPYRGNASYYKGSVKWITSGELNFNFITDTLEHISNEAVKKTNLKIHPVGTFLMAITGLEAEGTRGACGIVGNPSTTNQSCMAIYPTSALKTEFLYHYYVLRGDELALNYCQGTKQQSYTAKLVRLLPIDLPPTIDEQIAISENLNSMNLEIEAMEVKLIKARQIKQGMMQQLLTGRIRLV